jgi:hypothetical protein
MVKVADIKSFVPFTTFSSNSPRNVEFIGKLSSRKVYRMLVVLRLRFMSDETWQKLASLQNIGGFTCTCMCLKKCRDWHLIPCFTSKARISGTWDLLLPVKLKSDHNYNLYSVDAHKTKLKKGIIKKRVLGSGQHTFPCCCTWNSYLVA